MIAIPRKNTPCNLYHPRASISIYWGVYRLVNGLNYGISRLNTVVSSQTRFLRLGFRVLCFGLRVPELLSPTFIVIGARREGLKDPDPKGAQQTELFHSDLLPKPGDGSLRLQKN